MKSHVLLNVIISGIVSLVNLFLMVCITLLVVSVNPAVAKHAGLTMLLAVIGAMFAFFSIFIGCAGMADAAKRLNRNVEIDTAQFNTQAIFSAIAFVIFIAMLFVVKL